MKMMFLLLVPTFSNAGINLRIKGDEPSILISGRLDSLYNADNPFDRDQKTIRSGLQKFEALDWLLDCEFSMTEGAKDYLM